MHVSVCQASIKLLEQGEDIFIWITDMIGWESNKYLYLSKAGPGMFLLINFLDERNVMSRPRSEWKDHKYFNYNLTLIVLLLFVLQKLTHQATPGAWTF